MGHGVRSGPSLRERLVLPLQSATQRGAQPGRRRFGARAVAAAEARGQQGNEGHGESAEAADQRQPKGPEGSKVRLQHSFRTGSHVCHCTRQTF